MAVAILLGGFVGLLIAGVVLAVGMAARARREWEDLDDAFAEAGSQRPDPEAVQAPWSSLDLAALRDDVAAVDQHDPFATLTRTSAPISWHVPSNGNGSEPKRIAWRASAKAGATS